MVFEQLEEAAGGIAAGKGLPCEEIAGEDKIAAVAL